MSCGLPALSTRLLGLHETVSPGTGTLVAPDDPAELAQAMSDMIDLTPAQHRAMAAAARAKAVAEFSLLHEVSTIVGWMTDESPKAGDKGPTASTGAGAGLVAPG
jgi:glycogen synthase